MTEVIRALPVEDFDTLATMTDTERATWPYAVGCLMPSDEHVTVTRYSDKASADLMAHLMTGGDNVVTRWVAVEGTEWNPLTPVPGWRQVSTFNV